MGGSRGAPSEDKKEKHIDDKGGSSGVVDIKGSEGNNSRLDDIVPEEADGSTAEEQEKQSPAGTTNAFRKNLKKSLVKIRRMLRMGNGGKKEDEVSNKEEEATSEASMVVGVGKGTSLSYRAGLYAQKIKKNRRNVYSAC